MNSKSRNYVLWFIFGIILGVIGDNDILFLILFTLFIIYLIGEW